MREIKFRAWDKDTNKFLTGKEGDEIKTTIRVDLENGFLVRYNSIELMQYTGLKDTLGKEIYEGDILTHVVQLREEYTPFEAKEVVRWKTSIAGFEGRGFDRCKIIGNIYENPELLK